MNSDIITFHHKFPVAFLLGNWLNEQIHDQVRLESVVIVKSENLREKCKAFHICMYFLNEV